VPPIKRLAFDVSLDQAAAILAAFDPELSPERITPLQDGSTEVYRIDLVGGGAPLVLKLYADEPAWRAGKERRVAEMLKADTTITIPHWLVFDESRAILPLRFALTTWVPGTPLRQWFAEPDLDDVYRQVGALVRAFHTVPMPAYGYLHDRGLIDPEPTNAAYMTGTFGRALGRFLDGGGDADLARRLEDLFAQNADVLMEIGGPVLCHDDFHQGNILAEQAADGRLRLTGLGDFGNARSADRLFDLAKALFCCAHEDPRSPGPILEGYGAIDHPDPQRALWVYMLHHRLSMWGWLTRLGDDPAAPDGPGGILRDLQAMAELGLASEVFEVAD